MLLQDIIPTIQLAIGHVILISGIGLLLLSIALAIVSVLMAALLIVVLFASTGLQLETPLLVTGLFITCMSCLIASLILLVMDVNLSLKALKLEVYALVGREPSQADNAKQ